MTMKKVNATRLDEDLTLVANTIRNKTNSYEKMEFPSGFVKEINSLSLPKLEQEKSITINSNGIKSVTPDLGQVLSKVIITTDVPTSGGGSSNIEISHTYVPDMPKFTSNKGSVEVWGWGQGKSPTGNEWDRPSYIFLGTKFSEYIGGAEVDLYDLAIANDGSVLGIPRIEKGELMAIRKEQ